MRTTIIDFPYPHEDYQEDLVVEVEFILAKAVADPDSDWDAKDHLEIISQVVSHRGDVLDIDIPSCVIYSEVNSMIRNAFIQRALAEEDGGF